jgi:hypothetical protein
VPTGENNVRWEEVVGRLLPERPGMVRPVQLGDAAPSHVHEQQPQVVRSNSDHLGRRARRQLNLWRVCWWFEGGSRVVFEPQPPVVYSNSDYLLGRAPRPLHLNRSILMD